MAEADPRPGLGSRIARRFARVVFGTFLALVALELCLQLVALVVESTNTRNDESVEGGVLCIGDSFTFGFGADDPENSYPRELERQLRAQGLEVDVVNSGWPGRDSATALRLIDDQLADYSPRLVYLLIGYNDFWSGQPDDPGFFDRLRTVRFARMLWAWANGTLEQPTEDDPQPDTDRATTRRDRSLVDRSLADRSKAPFLGPWHAQNLRLIFRADSSIHTQGDNLPFLWNWDGELIQLRHRESDTTAEVTFAIDGDTLTLEGGPFGTGTRWERGLGDGDALERSIRLRAEGEVSAADRLLTEARNDPGPRGDEAWLTWVRLQVARLRVAAAAIVELESAIPTLVARFERTPPTAAAGRAVIEAMLATDQEAELGPILSRFVRTQAAGSSEALFLDLKQRDPKLVQTLERAVSANLRDETLGSERLTELWALYVLFDPEDGRRHAGALVAALRFDLGNQKVRRNMTRRKRCTREEFLAEVERQEPDPQRRLVMLEAFDDAAAGKDSTREVLWSNLRSIVDRCRSQGAEVVLLNYPNGRPELAELYREFAAENDLMAIDVFGEFRRRVEETELPGLFIFDGHCNDEGYRLMGRIVAEDAIPRLR